RQRILRLLQLILQTILSVRSTLSLCFQLLLSRSQTINSRQRLRGLRTILSRSLIQLRLSNLSLSLSRLNLTSRHISLSSHTLLSTLNLSSQRINIRLRSVKGLGHRRAHFLASTRGVLLNASKHATKLLCQLGSFRSNGDVTSSKFNRCQSDPHGLMQGRHRPRLAGAFLRDMNLFVPAQQLAKILDLRRLHLQDFRFLLLIPRPWNRLRDLSTLDALATIHHSNKLADPVINASQHVEHRVEPEPVQIGRAHV